MLAMLSASSRTKRNSFSPHVLTRYGATLGLLLLTGCGGGSNAGSGASTVPTAPPPEPAPPVSSPAALAASDADALLAYFKDKIKTNVTQIVAVTASPTVAFAPSPSPSPVSVSAVASPAVTATTTAPSVATPATVSGTLLQEDGVDEDDLVKTDGSTLYALSRSSYVNGATVPAQLQAQRILADGKLAPAGTLNFANDISRTGMYFVKTAKRLAVIGQQSYATAVPVPVAAPVPATTPTTTSTVMPGPVVTLPYAYASRLSIELVATDVVGALPVTNRIRMDGSMVGTRMVGSVLYVVSRWMPDVNRYAVTRTMAPAEVEARLAPLKLADILPTMQIDDRAAEPLVNATDCYLQTSNASTQLQLTVVTAIDVASNTLQRSSRCFVGGSDGFYMSPSNVYLSSSRYYTYPANGAAASTLGMPTGSLTDIHKFSLAGMQINYKGSGEVKGHLGWDTEKIPYRMSEYQGDLRVITYTGSNGWSVANNGASAGAVPANLPAASPAQLTVLREAANGKILSTVSTLPNAQRPAALGHAGEQVYAVEFVGPRAYVVTFRRTDPLYVLDVSNAADPKAVGELAMPGFSDYLFPLGDKLLLGVGKDATSAGVAQGVKIALMDVADASKPSLINSVVLGKSGSASALDTSRHGINILQRGGVFQIALPVRINATPTTYSSSFFNPTSQGLARFEVDSSAKTLTTKSTVTSVTYNTTALSNLAYGQYDVGQERAVQIDAAVYYLTGGRFLASSW